MLFRLTEIKKSYSGHEVLRGVTFQLNPGEKAGLVGRNGAGKTTVFRIIEGNESPDSGTLETAGSLELGILTQHVSFDRDETVHTAALSAFEELRQTEAEMRELEIRMAEDAPPEVLEGYAALQTRFEHLGGFEYVAKAEAVLTGLGFNREQWDMKTSQLSGGQKNRLGMVRLLLSDANVLLLDEPTNHLDVATVEWLENYLAEWDQAYLIISHDRYFLDRTCNRIIEIEHGKAYSYSGSYSKYAKDSKLRKEQMRREYENQQAFINKTEAFIRKNLAGQKTKQAKSRRNMLERLERKSAVSDSKKSTGFKLGKVRRTGSDVLTLRGLTIGYTDTMIASGINLSLHRGDCLGVIGGNGSGKTTLLKTILGELREISGTLAWGTKVETGYYSQELHDLNPANDVISELRTIAPDAEAGDLRSFLAGFLFLGEDVFKQVKDLSGGEKGRLALSKLIYSRANVLVLDEPTNHLDIPSREALESALEAFDGTIITVSHDRYFLDRLANQVLSFEADGLVETFTGNYTEFHDWKEKSAGNQPEHEAANVAIAAPTTPAVEAERGLSKNEIVRRRERIEKLEDRVNQLEEKAGRLSLKLSEPEAGTDRRAFEDLSKEYESTEREIESAMKEWESLVAEIGE